MIREDELIAKLKKAHRKSNEQAGTGLEYRVYDEDGAYDIEESLQSSWIKGRKYIYTFESGAEKMDYTEDELDNMDEDFIQYELNTILRQIENEQANSMC